MDGIDFIELSSGLITWFTSQDIVIADDVAAVLFGLDEDDCHLGVGVEMFLASISPRDRPRISQALYTCIARCETIHEVFEICTDGKTKMVVMKGRSVGDVLFTCIVTEIDEGRATAKLQNLCLAAYDVARQEKNDTAALQLIRTLSLLTDRQAAQRTH
ncbi:hypothetical protein [Rhizobium sp. 2MFCol3.1]|uniref:hypothetical protein n=1 Tax=Rhizobium sp. 2MFCol3.1 TaxID=1246459 RepID=UPI0003732205|nr:hypothetical protein [Rhizobium sp. 2MFCol3.1]